MTTEAEMDPLIEAGDEWPIIPVTNASITFSLSIVDITHLGEAMDLATVSIGRYGVDPLDVYVQDQDDPERRWLLRDGALYDVSDRGLRYAEQRAASRADGKAADTDA